MSYTRSRIYQLVHNPGDSGANDTLGSLASWLPAVYTESSHARDTVSFFDPRFDSRWYRTRAGKTPPRQYTRAVTCDLSVLDFDPEDTSHVTEPDSA